MKFREMAELLQPIYRTNDWRWLRAKSKDSKVPSVVQIERTIVRLYSTVVSDKDARSVESGRLKVSRILDEYGNTERFELALVLPWEDDDLPWAGEAT